MQIKTQVSMLVHCCHCPQNTPLYSSFYYLESETFRDWCFSDFVVPTYSSFTRGLHKCISEKSGLKKIESYQIRIICNNTHIHVLDIQG